MFKKSLLSIITLLALTFGALGVTSAQAAGILYVKAGGAGNCSSWATACNLQAALTKATSGQEIWVAAGTHKPGTTRAATFRLKNGVAVYGGFAGNETARTQRAPAAHVTILSGDVDNNDSQTPIITNLATVTGNITNSYHVVTGTAGATIDGFTITAGNANEWSATGGGMSSAGNPTLLNIIFRGNTASHSGGGMYSSGGSPTLTNVTFIDNAAEQFNGGGMESYSGTPQLMNVIFYNNSARFGGGLSSGSSILTNVTFSNNLATEKGGGIYSQGNPKLTKVVFDNNKAAQGGGMYNAYNNSMLTDVIFRNNSASQDGGGLYTNNNVNLITNATFSNNSANNGGGIYNSNYASELRLNNVTFNGNSASNNGGGIYDASWSMAVLNNITFRNNSAAKNGGAINSYEGVIYISNTIFWGNTSPTGAQISKIRGLLEIYDSVIQSGCPVGIACTDIITANPLLGVLGNYGGFTQTIPLLAGSSAIDAGNDANCPATDQRGVNRPYGTHCDIGAFEYIVPVLNTLTLNSIAGQDGWILESSETSAVGAAVNSNAATFALGDSATKQQYLGLLAFNTGSLPDAAIITGVTLKVKKQAVVGGGDPLATFQGFVIDLKNGYFGSSMLLQTSDFQDPASKTLGPVSPAPVTDIYSINLINGKDYINKLSSNNGLTQIRLRFKLDDNNNALANYLSLYSGDAVNAADRPQLVIQYYLLNAPTLTPTKTRTATRTNTPTSTKTKTPTLTSTPTASVTPTGTSTPTLVETETPTPTEAETGTPTVTPTETETPTLTP